MSQRVRREDYVRPPIVAVEPGSGRAAVWRFRIVFGLVLTAVAIGVFLLYRALVASPGEGNPGFNQGARVAVVGVQPLAVRA